MKGKNAVRVLAVLALLIVLAWNSFYLQDYQNISVASKRDVHIVNAENEIEEAADIQKGGEVPDTEEQTATETTEEPKWPIVVYTGLNDIDAVFPTENIYCVNTGDGYRYLTQGGKELTGELYEKAYPFHEGFACVCKDGKFGYIDRNGETVIPFKYEDASPFMEGLAYFCKDGKYGFMDYTGTPQFYLDCDSVSAFVEGLAYICVDGKYGYIDKTGKTVIESVYNDAEYFEDGLAQVVKDSKRGIIDQTGREVVKSEYIEIERVQSYFLAKKNEMYDIFDLEGNLLSEQVFSSAFWDGMKLGIKLYNNELGISGFICQGNVYVFDTCYYIAKVIPEQKLAIVQSDKFYGVINFEGETQIPFSYNTIWYYESENVFLVENSDEKWGVLDGGDFTAWRVPCNYDSIDATDPVKGMLEVEKGEKYGIIGLNEELVLPISYDRVDILENGAYFASKDDITWLYDPKGTLLYQGKYSYISYVDGCYEVDDGESIGYLDAAGKKIFSVGEHYYKSYMGFSYPGIEILNHIMVEDEYAYIVQTREIAEDELPECLFENKITPRNLPLWEFLKDGSFEAESEGDWNTVDFSQCDRDKISSRFYDFSDTGKPVLYVSVSVYDFGRVSSGFFTVEGDEVVCLLSGYECGGSLKGDYLCLWYDKEEGKLMFGKDGYVGNIASYTSYSEVYDYEGGFFPQYIWREEGGTHADSEYYLDGKPVIGGEYLERTEYCEKRYEYISLPK